jgi:hypothetical protein
VVLVVFCEVPDLLLCTDLLLRTDLLGLLGLLGPPPDPFRLGSTPGVVAPPDCSIPDILPFGRDPGTVPAAVAVKLGAASSSSTASSSSSLPLSSSSPSTSSSPSSSLSSSPSSSPATWLWFQQSGCVQALDDSS